jgi:chaperonin GroEL (HSP60 family)
LTTSKSKRKQASIQDTKLIRGIALDKEVVHAGMPKRIENARIALINSALEIEKTEMSAEMSAETIVEGPPMSYCIYKMGVMISCDE